MAKSKSKSKRKAIDNPRNIYRVRTGWYLQLQWAGRVYRQLFSDSRFGGRDGALKKAVTNRDWLNKYRAEHEACMPKLTAAVEAQDQQAYERAITELTTTIGKKLSGSRGDRAVYDEYFSAERGYVAAQ